MSALASLLESGIEVVVVEWLRRARDLHEPEEASAIELRDHVPAFLREIVEALRAGKVTESRAAREHGRQREELGFDLDIVVREYGLLLDTVLAFAEGEAASPSLAEVRLVGRQISRGIDESVATYQRRQDRIIRDEQSVAANSEAELRIVLDAFPSLVSFVTREGRYGLVNRTYEDWFKVESAQLRGRRVRDVIGEAAWEKLGPSVERALAGERFAFEQHDVPYRGAGVRDVAVNFIPRFDRFGAPNGYVALVTDITARRHSERERERLLVAERVARRDADVQRLHLQTLVANAPIGIATWRGADHVFASANALYLGILQRDPGIIGQPIRQAFADVPPDHEVFEIWDRVYRTGVAHVDPGYRISLVLDGRPQERVFLLHLVPTFDPDGDIDGTMASFTDVTQNHQLRELVEIERDLANAVAEQEAFSRAHAERLVAQSSFLLDVANVLASSLEVDVILARLAAAVTPSRAKFAGAWMRGMDGRLRRVAHAPPTLTLLGPEGPLTPEINGAVTLPIERVYATGTPLHIDDYERWMTAEGAPEVGRLGPAAGFGPCMFVPLLRGAEVVAVLSIKRAIGAAFTDEDVAIFESVARIAALSLENARLYAQMAQLRHAAEEATRAKDRFLANVSHDLRNPLGSILGWSSILRMLPDPSPQLKRGVDVIERNAKAQVQLIEDLLDVSRIASGKLALSFAVENVAAAVDAALDPARIAATAKNIALSVDVDPEIGAIAVDPDRFRQILWNLVSNAVKFTPPGGTVRVRATRHGGSVELVVEDTGRGIPAAFLPRVFGAFEQVQAGEKRSGGLGLGLAIVKHLVELHGGSIRVESDGENTGTRFVVVLPIRAAVTGSNPPGAVRGVLHGLQLLVVDDEDDARDIVAFILEQAGASVVSASSVADGLDAMLRSRPDVVVSDISMPGKSGIDLVRAIRALPEAQGGSVPVVALTALIGTRDRNRVLDAGFDAHLGKPIEAAELIAQIAELVGRAAR